MRRRAGETPNVAGARGAGRGTRSIGLALPLAVTLLSALAEAEPAAPPEDRPPSIAVEASCEPVAGPGKVRCAVHVRPREGVWRWGDVIVVAAPAFARPLRTRAGVSEIVRKTEAEMEFALALGATADGSGVLRVKARAVVCGENGCRPVEAEAEARVVVGAPQP
jgi:hypothetical protein